MKSMKRLIVVLVAVFMTTVFGYAQSAGNDSDVKKEDYERYYEQKMEVNFRNYVLEELELTSEEIVNIDPLLRDYLNERTRLAEEKLDLINEYEEEMKEEDSAADEAEESSDFIEDYWELSIDEMELKEEYFEEFEDEISYQKALEFFFLEDDMQYRIARPYLIKISPSMSSNDSFFSDKWNSDKERQNRKMNEANNQKNNSWDKQNDYSNTKQAGNRDSDDFSFAFTSWFESTNETVSLDHDYTREGLNSIAEDFKKFASLNLIDKNRAESVSSQLNKKGKKIQKDWTSDMHADWVRDAFTMVSNRLGELDLDQYDVSDDVSAMISGLKSSAKNISNEALLTDQANSVNSFFKELNKIMTELENTRGISVNASDDDMDKRK